MTNLFKIIWNFIKKVIDLFGDHGDKVAKVATAVGGAAAAVGVGAGIRANLVNKKALTIRAEALSEFKESDTQTEKAMKELGNLQIEMMKTFDSFIETMEKIQRRPKGLKNKLAEVTLPDFKPEELKTLSNNLQMTIAVTGGTAAGIGVGVAAFGVNALALGPGALAGGVVLCVKGVSLSKKATRNKQEAIQLQKDVENICRYHSQLRVSANMLYQSISEVKPQYFSHLIALKNLVSQKTDYREYSREEQLLIRNSILLVSLVHNMCKVTLVQKAKSENSMETVNEKEVKRIVELAQSSLSEINPIPQASAV